MHVSRKIVTLAVLFPFAFTSVPTWAQRATAPADARIVGSNTPVQDQEEPEVKAAAPSVESAWNMLTTATHKAVVTHISAMAALGTMGSNARLALIHISGRFRTRARRR